MSLTKLARNLFHRRRAELDLDDEVRSYLDLLVEQNLAAGMNESEAHRQARLELGGVEQVKESVRGMRHGAWLDQLGKDLQYALRTLRRSPGFAFAAVLSLGLGVGANTTVFSLVHAVLLRQLPYPEPDRLVRVVRKAGPADVSMDEFEFWTTAPFSLRWRLIAAPMIAVLLQRGLRSGSRSSR